MIDEISHTCLLTRSRRISRVITSLFDQELRQFGVNAAQFSLLVLITRLDGASRAEIGRANHLERSTSTRNLQLLLAEGWAEERPPVSGRSRPIVISHSGRELLTAALPAWRSAQFQAQELLGEAGANAIVKLADALSSD